MKDQSHETRKSHWQPSIAELATQQILDALPIVFRQAFQRDRALANEISKFQKRLKGFQSQQWRTHQEIERGLRR